jgi:hypothetical protein
MRRILYVYPKRWRDRYADEMDQLLDDAPLTVRGAASIGVHAARVRLRDGATLSTLSALVAAAALLPIISLGILWVNFVVLPEPMDAGIALGILHRLQPSEALPFLGLIAAVAPMLQAVVRPEGRMGARIRWRSYPIHAGLALIAIAWIAVLVAHLYDVVWHAVARWYWALCATSCHEPWMAPLSLARIIYPWILLLPAGWLVWRWGRRRLER